MILPLLASAADAATEAGSSGSPLAFFNVQLGYFLSQLVSFAIVGSALYFFVLKPVLGTMSERTRKIEDGLRHAKDMEARLAAAQADATEKLRAASIEAGKIVAEARTFAKEIETRAQAEAQTRTEDMIRKATQAIELDRQKVMNEARAEITRLVVTTAEKVLRTELSEADKGRFNAAASRELAGV